MTTAYAYVYSNPLRFSDPTGQNPLLIAFIMGAYMGGSQGFAKGGWQGMVQGAFLGGFTAVLSAGAGMTVGGWASGAFGTLGGAVAGTVVGFAVSYGVRGMLSGNWSFTTMDGINLAIAIVFCLLDPRPGVSEPVVEQHIAAQEATEGINDALGGTGTDALVEVKIESWIGEPSDGVLPTATKVNVTQWTRGSDGTWTSKVVAYIEEYGHIALDAAGTVDPTPFCDTVNTVWYLVEGDISNAGMSGISALPYVGDIIGKGGRAALGVAGVRGWKVGEAITNLTKNGKIPVWSTVYRRFWKNEALNNAGEYTAENLARMRRGLAEQRENPVTGVLESRHLHHDPPQSQDGLFKFQPKWPDEHAEIHYKK